ncbi:MAG: hypothetical protein R2695_02110 [Acidimicrobiales bacterium]
MTHRPLGAVLLLTLGLLLVGPMATAAPRTTSRISAGRSSGAPMPGRSPNTPVTGVATPSCSPSRSSSAASASS